jgi:NAD(P)-dependent dehydrogenase (short-subunit alcohol dehydrogenase family)
MAGRLQGRVALISGGGSGIGRATAELFAAEGAQVAVLDVDADAATQTVETVGDSSGGTIAVVANVCSEPEVNDAVAETIARLGDIDILFNNAGIDVTGSILDLTEEEWDRCFDVNVKGVYLLSKAVAKTMIDHRGEGGVIVNQASVAAQVGVPNLAAYCAAKGAVVSLTRAMAIDLAPLEIRVNAICPGTVFTPLIGALLSARGDGDFEAGLAKTVAKYPIGRLGTAQEIAEVALFLASDESRFMTGSIVVADGGMTAQ